MSACHGTETGAMEILGEATKEREYGTGGDDGHMVLAVLWVCRRVPPFGGAPSRLKEHGPLVLPLGVRTCSPSEEGTLHAWMGGDWMPTRFAGG